MNKVQVGVAVGLGTLVLGGVYFLGRYLIKKNEIETIQDVTDIMEDVFERAKEKVVSKKQDTDIEDVVHPEETNYDEKQNDVVSDTEPSCTEDFIDETRSWFIVPPPPSSEGTKPKKIYKTIIEIDSEEVNIIDQLEKSDTGEVRCPNGIRITHYRRKS